MIQFFIILLLVLLHPISDAIRDCGYKKQQKQGMIAYIILFIMLNYFSISHDVLYIIVLLFTYCCLRISFHDIVYVIIWNLEHEKKDHLPWYYVGSTSGVWSRRIGNMNKWEALTGRIVTLLCSIGFYLLWLKIWK